MTKEQLEARHKIKDMFNLNNAKVKELSKNKIKCILCGYFCGLIWLLSDEV